MQPLPKIGQPLTQTFCLLKIYFSPQALTSNNKFLYLRLLRLNFKSNWRRRCCCCCARAAWGRRRRSFDGDLALLLGSTSIELDAKSILASMMGFDSLFVLRILVVPRTDVAVVGEAAVMSWRRSRPENMFHIFRNQIIISYKMIDYFGSLFLRRSLLI